MTMSSTSNTMRRIFQEATHLTHQFYRHRPTSIIQTRQILQQTVNGASGTSATSNITSNSLAMTLLKVDKEIVYMKYEGLSQYFTKRFQDSTMKRKMFNPLPTADTCSTGATTTSTASTSSSTNRSTSTSTSTSNQRKARIAFMITKQQKQILAQRFHYTPTMIKTLKPTEALLIIENGLHAYDYDKAGGAEKVQLEGVQERRKLWKTKLDALVKENEALVERQQEEQQKEHEGLGLEKLQEQEDVQMETEEETKMYMYEVIEQVALPSVSSSSTSTALSTALSTEISTSSTIFTSEVVLALYKTEEEAQECIDIKLDLMNKRNQKQESKENAKMKHASGNGLKKGKVSAQYKIQKRAM